MSLRSRKVTYKNRAGRAPYNFVPLPERCFSSPEPKPQDVWARIDEKGRAEAWSGYLEFDLRALTPFYTRGMWSLEDFRNQKKEEKQIRPFSVSDRLRLPGSSIRGMIRTLVEILGSAPLDPANDASLAYRAVAETVEHPLAGRYKEWLTNSGYEAMPKAKPGWLHVDDSGEKWWIHPSRGTLGKDKDPYSEDWKEHWERGLSPARESRVRSGYIRKKRAVWKVPPEDPSRRIPLTDQDIRLYKRTITSTLEERGWVYGAPGGAAPVFYITISGGVTLFGHTPFFRVPYLRGVAEANRRPRAADGSWDLAQAIFGRAPERKGSAGVRSRVYFEDGVHVGGPDGYQRDPCSFVLGSPKPTTFQHYLVQNGEDVDQVLHWESPAATLRGHKLYWHRPNAVLPSPVSGKAATQFSPGQSGAVFRAKIRFDQLTPYELGLLLLAVVLPAGCAHHLGMAKAHGFGSFGVENVRMSLFDRTGRYKEFAEGNHLVETRLPVTPELIEQFQRVLVKMLYRCDSLEQFWTLGRFHDLKVMLSMPAGQVNWLGRTRYLEFGTIPGFNVNRKSGRETPYNEYVSSGYPERDEAYQERLKVLPPASQVWEDASLPSDERPPFRPERERR